MAKLTCRKELRLSPEERDLLKRKSEELNITESRYIRMLLTHTPADYPEIQELLRNLNNEINHIGVNINQIVYSHNAGIYSPGDREKLELLLKLVKGKLTQAVESMYGN